MLSVFSLGSIYIFRAHHCNEEPVSLSISDDSLMQITPRKRRFASATRKLNVRGSKRRNEYAENGVNHCATSPRLMIVNKTRFFSAPRIYIYIYVAIFITEACLRE